MVFYWPACCAIKNFASLITYKLRRRPRLVTRKTGENYADKLKGFAHMFSMASKEGEWGKGKTGGWQH